jgi:hypothetical protein
MKDETGEWKFRTIDYAEINQGLIKEIQTPQIDESRPHLPTYPLKKNPFTPQTHNIHPIAKF